MRYLSATFGAYSLPVERVGGVGNVGGALRVFRRPGWPGTFRVGIGDRVVVGRVPPASGRDAHKAVINAAGQETDYWGLSWPGAATTNAPQHAGVLSWENVAGGFDPGRDALAASVVECRRPDGSWMDVDRDTGNTAGFICAPLSRGVVTPAEVASGVVRHALRCSTPIPLAGLQAPPDVDMDDPRIGVEFAASGLPCGSVEGVVERGDDKTRLIPHGLHVVVRRTNRQIEGDLDAAGLSGGEREVSRVLRVAARNYGIVFLLSSPAGTVPTVQLDGSDPGAWERLGVTRGGSRLFAGAVPSASCLRALAWPTATVGGITTSRAGWVDAMTVPLRPGKR